MRATRACRRREIAGQLDIRTPSANRTLDHLEAAGLIERRPDPDDKRQNRLFLPPPGRAQAERVVAFTEELRREIFLDVSVKELEGNVSV